MNYKQSTQVPNRIFDELLPLLSMAELKILLVIIRQTYGWINPETKRRKQRDRISHAQFISKTGLSRRIIITTIQKLLNKHYIKITNQCGELLHLPEQRKGKRRLYYEVALRKKRKNHSRLNKTSPIQKLLQRYLKIN